VPDAEVPVSEALSATQLSVKRAAREVLREVSLSLSFGEVMAVLGPNGAGKSTLLRALCGLIPASGKVTLAGHDLHTLSSEQRARAISFVPQQSRLDAALPVHDVVAQGRYARRTGFARLSSADRAAIAGALADTDAQSLSERRFDELSVGEQRRVLIARALATEARTLLLDEPTAALDIEHTLRLFALLQRLARRGHAIVVVLHQLEHALAHCPRALLLAGGELLASGPVAEVLSAERVRSVYGVTLLPGAGLGFRLPEAGP
jgi:iron complex transport system ATP-binding protein